MATTMAAPVGYSAMAFAQAGRATFGAAMLGAASGAVGGLLPGTFGVATSAGIGGLSISLPAAGASAFGAVFAYRGLMIIRDVHCESKCSAY